MNIVSIYSIILSFQLNFWCYDTKKDITIQYGEKQEIFKKSGFFYPEVFVSNENIIIIRTALSSSDIIIQKFYVYYREENGRRLEYTTLSSNHYVTRYKNTFQLYKQFQLTETTTSISVLENWIKLMLIEI